MNDHSVSDFGKDNSLINEAVVTGRKVGAGQGFWSKLAQDEKFFQQVVNLYDATFASKFVIVPTDIIIDFDATPFIPEGHGIRASDQIKSRLKGKWKFDPKAIKTYLSKRQKQGKTILGSNLKDDLEGEVGVESAVGQPGVGHQRRDSRAVDAVPLEPSAGRLDDPPPRRLLVLVPVPRHIYLPLVVEGRLALRS